MQIEINDEEWDMICNSIHQQIARLNEFSSRWLNFDYEIAKHHALLMKIEAAKRA